MSLCLVSDLGAQLAAAGAAVLMDETDPSKGAVLPDVIFTVDSAEVANMNYRGQLSSQTMLNVSDILMDVFALVSGIGGPSGPARPN
jgi:hypothetical protein